MEKGITYDLSAFKLVGPNREIKPAHVKEIKSKIRANGWQDTGIVVNSKMEVIDGQHRVVALRELQEEDPEFKNIAVSYDINSSQNASPFIYNTASKNWNNQDYTHYYAAQGKESYRLLEDLYKHYNPPISFTVIEETAFAVCGTGRTAAAIREGDLALTKDGFEKAKDFLDWGCTVYKVIKEKGATTQHFRFLLKTFFDPDVDNVQMAYQINNNPQLIKKTATVEEIPIMFDKVYNYRRSVNTCNLLGRYKNNKRKKS